ncbi:MAG: domain S-box protein [Marmoricola sp.]|nr:domain S-box protein [Marmoricola sp.]
MSSVPSPEPGLVDESDPTAEARALRVLFDGLPAMIGYWDSNLRNVIANEAYVDWFGISPSTMKGIHISEIVSEAVYRANMPYMTAALAGQQQTFQRTLVDVTGMIRHAQVSYSPDVADGEVLGLFVMITDITAEIEAQRQLDEAQELAELGSWTLIPSTGEITWSRQLYALMRKDPETFNPALDSLLPELHPDDRERVLEVSSSAMRTGSNYDLRYRLMGPQEEIREMHSRVRAERDPSGAVSRMTGTIQDVTSSNVLSREMARVNEELRHVNQLNADVLGVVGHDVRTPLALVLGHLEELTATWTEISEEDRLARVDRAFNAAVRLSSLIDDILAMANFDSGTIATRPIRVLVHEVVQDALTAVRAGSQVEVQVTGTPRQRDRPVPPAPDDHQPGQQRPALRRAAGARDGRRVRRLGPARGGRPRRRRARRLRAAPLRPLHPCLDRGGHGTLGQRVRPLHRWPTGGGRRLPAQLCPRRAVGVAVQPRPAGRPRLRIPSRNGQRRTGSRSRRRRSLSWRSCCPVGRRVLSPVVRPPRMPVSRPIRSSYSALVITWQATTSAPVADLIDAIALTPAWVRLSASKVIRNSW